MTIFKTKADYLAWQWESCVLKHESELIDEFLLLRKNGVKTSDRFDEAFKSVSERVFSEGRLPSKKTGRPRRSTVAVEKQRQATREYLMEMRSGAGHVTALAAACRICLIDDRQALRFIKKHRFWEEMTLIAEDKRRDTLRLVEGLRRMYLHTCRVEVCDKAGRLLFYREPRDDDRIFQMKDGPWITVAMARECLRMVDEKLEEYLQDFENRVEPLYSLVRRLTSEKNALLEGRQGEISCEEINYIKEAHEHALMAYTMFGEFLVRSIDSFGWSPRSRIALDNSLRRMTAITDSLKSLDPLTADKNAP